ncbi:hypothetical protein ACKKBG_A08850 [Auxenochlorella protothecoides x Auxenochlorella symbiontica]
MRAVVCTRLGDASKPFGSPDAPLALVDDQPRQQLPSKGVRIRVSAGALNFADALMVKGTYQEKPPLPFIPGSECSGTVIEVGSGVRSVAVGDKVCALTPSQALCEEAVADEASVVRLDPSTSEARLEEAAGLPVTYGTAYLALVDRARLAPGQTLLVLGAGGGVGLAAVQLGRALGARVVAVARGPEKGVVLRAAGADAVIDSAAAGKLRDAIKAAAPRGVDVVLDPVGGDHFFEAFKCVAWGAHMLVIGFAGGVPKIPANIALVKNTTIHGIYWGSYQRKQPAVFRRSLDECAALFSQGKVSVHASHRFPLEQAPEAFAVLMNRGVIGKLLVLPRKQARI